MTVTTCGRGQLAHDFGETHRTKKNKSKSTFRLVKYDARDERKQKKNVDF
jgi:hypothetical protein